MVETMVRQETGYLQVQDILYHDEPSMDHTFELTGEVEEALDPFEDEIRYTVPRISGFSLAAKEMTTKPSMVSGIDPVKEDRLRGLSLNIVDGKMFAADDDYAVIAQGLAEMLDIGVGDTLVLLGQGFQAMTAAGKFEVGGIVEFSIPEQNNMMVFLPLSRAQWYFAAENRLTGLIIMPRDEEEIDQLAKSIQGRLDDDWYAVRTWKELMPDMVGLMEMQDTVYKIIAWVFYIIVGFGIFGTILTMLYERMHEFGMLLSLGMKRVRLATVGLMETVMIGFIGVIAGIAAGYPIMYLFHLYPIEFKGEIAEYMLDMGFEPVVALSVEPSIFLYQAFTVFGITLVIGLYTMRKIFSINILDATRN